MLRLPGWAQNKPVPSDLYRYIDGHTPRITLKVNGKRINPTMVKGYAVLERTWKDGDHLSLSMDMRSDGSGSSCRLV
jgi:DUF1680 family protein